MHWQWCTVPGEMQPAQEGRQAPAHSCLSWDPVTRRRPSGNQAAQVTCKGARCVVGVVAGAGAGGEDERSAWLGMSARRCSGGAAASKKCSCAAWFDVPRPQAHFAREAGRAPSSQPAHRVLVVQEH